MEIKKIIDIKGGALVHISENETPKSRNLLITVVVVYLMLFGSYPNSPVRSNSYNYNAPSQSSKAPIEVVARRSSTVFETPSEQARAGINQAATNQAATNQVATNQVAKSNLEKAIEETIEETIQESRINLKNRKKQANQIRNKD